MLESKCEPNSKYCLDVQTLEFGILLNLNNISFCTLKNVYYHVYIYYLAHTVQKKLNTVVHRAHLKKIKKIEIGHHPHRSQLRPVLAGEAAAVPEAGLV